MAKLKNKLLDLLDVMFLVLVIILIGIPTLALGLMILIGN